jgi:hypothetical protein
MGGELTKEVASCGDLARSASIGGLKVVSRDAMPVQGDDVTGRGPGTASTVAIQVRPSRAAVNWRHCSRPPAPLALRSKLLRGNSALRSHRGSSDVDVIKRTGRIPNHLREQISLGVSPDRWLAKARQLKKSSNLLFV